MNRGLCLRIGLGAFFSACAVAKASPFAARVVEYAPAPGQFVNHPDFNDPADALGPPEGFGLAAGNNASVVTLGGFGGYIILAFDHTVEDDALNPFGLDAIVFGNAFRVGNPSRHWAECATIEISADVNGNGICDDPWYLILGSHIDSAQEQWKWRTWDSDTTDPVFPPVHALWVPPGASGVWQTGAYELPAEVFGPNVVINIGGMDYEDIWGYADYSPTLRLGDMNADNIVDSHTADAADFYTRPDDPWTPGIAPGAGGGDAFDMAWAIDPDSGEPAGLTGFDFIRMTTAVAGAFTDVGEKSAEIDAVSDVSPDRFGDMDADGDIDLLDAAEFELCFGQSLEEIDGCDRADRQPDMLVNGEDAAAFVRRLTGPR